MFKKVYRSILWILTICCIIIGLHIHTSGGMSWFFHRLTGDGKGGQEIVKETITDSSYAGWHKLNIDVSVLDIKIASGKDYQIQYEGEKRLKPEITVQSDTLVISQKEKNGFIFFGGSKEGVLTITLPKDMKLSNADIASDTGEVSLRELSIDQMEMDLDTGELHLEQCQLGVGKLRTDTGEIYVEDSSMTEYEVRSDTGKIKMDQCHFDVLSCRTDTGDIEVEAADSLEDYYMELKTDTGTIEINDQKFEKKAVVGKENAKKKLSADTDTGDIRIR